MGPVPTGTTRNNAPDRLFDGSCTGLLVLLMRRSRNQRWLSNNETSISVAASLEGRFEECRDEVGDWEERSDDATSRTKQANWPRSSGDCFARNIHKVL